MRIKGVGRRKKIEKEGREKKGERLEKRKSG